MSAFRMLFGKYLLVTNTVSSGLMMAAGDILQQQSSNLKQFLENSNRVMAASQEKTLIDCITPIVEVRPNEHDYTRTINMTAIGLSHGTFNHYFYTLLDRVLPGKCVRSIMKKIFIDQLIASPVSLTIFFAGLGFLERRQVPEIKDEIKLKLREAWKVDCFFWPPVQIINFLFVQRHYRVLYISSMTFIFDIFLSYIKYDAEFN